MDKNWYDLNHLQCPLTDTEGGLVPKRLRAIATAVQDQYRDQMANGKDILTRRVQYKNAYWYDYQMIY